MDNLYLIMNKVPIITEKVYEKITCMYYASFMPNYVYHRHHLTYLAANHHDKSQFNIQAKYSID